MNLLESVLNETDMRAPKGIVYGPPGLGKTTLEPGQPIRSLSIVKMVLPM